MKRKAMLVVICLTLVITVFTIFPSNVSAVTEDEIEQAIEDGVVWLAGDQELDGSWPAFWEDVATTGLAVLKLETYAYEVGYESPFDPAYPYHENVINGLNYLFGSTVMYIESLSLQDHTTGATGTVDDPDVRNNGIGLYSLGSPYYFEVYDTGIVLAAISASGTPDRIVNVPGSIVDGWKYSEVAQDMIDWLAYAQADLGVGQGGWEYKAADNSPGKRPEDPNAISSYGPDNSNSGYAVLGLAYAQDFGCIIPNWVKIELNAYINNIQDPVNGDDDDGGSWYTAYSTAIGTNILKTGNLIFEMALVGDSPTTPRVVDALDYLERHWGDASGGNLPPGWDGNPAQYQAMFCAMKGLEYIGIDVFNGIDWYQDFAQKIVEQQSGDGSWQLSSGRGNPTIITAWALLVLEKVAPPPPQEILPPEVTKTVSPEDIIIGSGEKATVTIEVTGAGGTESTITPMDVVFAIDSSGSMTSSDPYNLRLDAAKDFVDKMVDTRDQAGVVSWDMIYPPTWPTGIDFTFGLSNDFDDIDGVKYWIDQVDASGGTDLNLGLDTAIDMLDAGKQTEASWIIIFLTDGMGLYTPSGSPGSPADEAASKGYIIYSIGLGSGHSPVPLQDMAAATGGVYYDSPDPENLEEIYNAIYEEITTSTVPHYVNVTEVTESYVVVDETSFNVEPDSITHNPDGTTTIIWENIGMYTDDDPDMSADEIVTLTFDIKFRTIGVDLDVDVEGESIVEYGDKDGNYIGYVEIPQATINVLPFVTDLIAGGGNPKSAIDVGDVVIWNDEDFLYITYVTYGDWFISGTHLHVAADLGDIPQTKKGNPIPGHFDYNTCHDPPVQNVLYTIPWTWAPETTLYIAAHADVVKIIEDCFEIVSDQSVLWSSDGISWENSYSTYVHPSWPSDPSIEGATWIWRTSITDPALEYATVPDGGWYFQKNFLIPGVPTSGEISINVDNAYELYLNNVMIGGEGSMSKDGPDFYEWNTIQSFDLLDYLNSDDNTILIRALNFFDAGTAYSNPAGIIFKMQVCYEYIEKEETAWGDGEIFEGANWATYIVYVDP
ncbi:MAG: VWA domain-containing protein [Promethearchaeota archaeon]